MNLTRLPTDPDPINIPVMPGWVTSARGGSPEDVALMSGAALATLHIVAARQEIPHALWRDRLALTAAEACVIRSGRSERAAHLRDAVCLLRAGDHPGPAGTVLQYWQGSTRRPLSVKTLHRALPELDPAEIARWLAGGHGTPVNRAAQVLQTVLAEAPHQETAALILAEATLSQALGWRHLMPLLAAGLGARDLLKTGDDLRLACHLALIKSATQATQSAHLLARRAARIKAVTPKLRAKGAARAVDLFLTRDALAPSSDLAPFMSDRAARRLCDRLVDLGALRELTGRDTFRLYGV